MSDQTGLHALVHRPLRRRQVDDRGHRDPDLERRGRLVEPLDGDVVRTHLSKGLGFSKEDRDTNIERIGWVASRFTRHGGVARRVGHLALRGDPPDGARAGRGVRPVRLVYVDASVDECARRDVKGLYAKAFSGEIKEFTGVSDPYEAAGRARSCVIETESEEPEDSAARVLAYLEQRGPHPGRGVARDDDRRPGSPPTAASSSTRTGERPTGVESLERVTLAPTEVADLDMLASGALSPLAASWARTTTPRRRRHAPRRRHALGAAGHAGRRRRRRRATASRWPTRTARRWPCSTSRGLRLRRPPRGRACFRTTDEAHPGVARIYGQPGTVPGRRRDGLRPPGAAVPGAGARSGRHARGVIAERGWQHGRRLPDAQPDPPRARVRHEVGARDRRRPARAPAGGRDEGRRRPGRGARRLLPRAARPLLPGQTARCSRPSRPPCATAARARPSGTRSAARTTAARTSSSGATTPASAATTARTTRSTSSTSLEGPELGIEPLMFEHSFYCRSCGVDGLGQDLPAPVGVSTSSSRARRCARCSARGERPPVEFSRPEVADILIAAYTPA